MSSHCFPFPPSFSLSLSLTHTHTHTHTNTHSLCRGSCLYHRTSQIGCAGRTMLVCTHIRLGRLWYANFAVRPLKASNSQQARMYLHFMKSRTSTGRTIWSSSLSILSSCNYAVSSSCIFVILFSRGRSSVPPSRRTRSNILSSHVRSLRLAIPSSVVWSRWRGERIKERKNNSTCHKLLRCIRTFQLPFRNEVTNFLRWSCSSHINQLGISFHNIRPKSNLKWVFGPPQKKNIAYTERVIELVPISIIL